MITEQDWRSVAVILAGNVASLVEMLRQGHPIKPESMEKLNEVEERCAQIIAFAAIQKGQQ